MKKLLFMIFASLMLSGCVAVPVYDSGYYYPFYVPYSYFYAGPEISVFVPGFRGGHSHDFRGGDFRGGRGSHGGRGHGGRR